MDTSHTPNITDIHGTLGALLRRPFENLLARVYRELAARAGITKQSMAYLVEDLRKLGYLRLVADPSDGRAKQVRLTPRGEAVQRAAMGISRGVENEWAGLLAPGEMTRLRKLLARLGERLKTQNP